MRTARGSRLLTAVATVALLAGCQSDYSHTDGLRTVEEIPQREGPPAGTDDSLREEALALVEQRERALVDGDREAFLATVDPEALAFVATQERWWDNMEQLPLTDVSYELGDESVMTQVAGAGDLQLPVDFTMRLEGFDDRPVTQRMVWTFVRSGDEVLLADDRNTRIEAMTDWVAAPWDLVHIEVRRSGGILGIFDTDTSQHASYVMRDLAGAAADVRRRLPWWDGRFVAYGTSDTTAIDTMSSMSVEGTAGLAFPIMSRPGGKVASYRFLVNPDVVSDVVSRTGVFRHEMVHVAFGTADDWSPTWLVEGIASYLEDSISWPPEQRRVILAVALRDVEAQQLSPGEEFYTTNPSLNYVMASAVCDYLASTRGEQTLWDLVGTYDEARPTTVGEVEAVLDRTIGMTSEELAAATLDWLAIS